MSSHSRVLRSCLVALLVWCVVAGRTSAAVARLAPSSVRHSHQADEQQNHEGKAHQKSTDFLDSNEHDDEEEIEPTAEDDYDAVMLGENEEEYAHDYLGQEDDELCEAPFLMKLFGLDDYMCENSNPAGYEIYLDSEE